MDEPFHSFASFLRRRLPGGPLRKIAIDAGLSCPNRDGTLAGDGCIFCDPYGAGPAAARGRSIESQIEERIARFPGRRFLAYYQAHCNTHGPLAELRRKYEVVFRYPEIAGLFVGTRPDALPGPVLALLAETGRRIYLCVELGLQSVHERSLAWLRRRHTYASFLEGFAALRRQGIDVVVHLIVGIPGETRDDMRATIAALNRLQPAGIKLHPLHVLRGTELERLHAAGRLPLLERDEYVEIACDLLERLDPAIAVHRLTADREGDLYVAPLWAQRKAEVLEAIRRRLRQQGHNQGWRLGIDKPAPMM